MTIFKYANPKPILGSGAAGRLCTARSGPVPEAADAGADAEYYVDALFADAEEHTSCLRIRKLHGKRYIVVLDAGH